jgi:hypothetical protein
MKYCDNVSKFLLLMIKSLMLILIIFLFLYLYKYLIHYLLSSFLLFLKTHFFVSVLWSWSVDKLYFNLLQAIACPQSPLSHFQNIHRCQVNFFTFNSQLFGTNDYLFLNDFGRGQRKGPAEKQS